MNVKYCGPALDYSGYGEANRHDIGALTAAGVSVFGEYTKHCLEIAEFGAMGALARKCAEQSGDYKIKIIHTTPNIFKRFMEPGKYHIGRVFWETDKLPPDFAAGAQAMDEIWTGSKFNEAAIRRAGVTKPIYIVPEAIDTSTPVPDPFITLNQGDFKFYSIFEWTNRKNPQALLEAFWREFEDTPGVSLTLKVYVDNFTPEKRFEVKNKFAELKTKLGLSIYAPVYIYTHLMNRDEIYRFHATFDCYVSAHRGEGWGIPQMEAMLMGRPIISTGCGGIHEYINRCARLIDYTLVPVADVDRNNQWYQADQNWAEVDIKELRFAMRWAYKNQDSAAMMGQDARESVIKQFSLPAVGGIMRARLEEIERSLTTI